MTTTSFTWPQPIGRRRATFVSSPAEVIARRVSTTVITAAVVLSTAAVGIITPLVF